MVIIDALCASEKYLAVVSELNENVRRLDVYKANDIFNRIQTTGIPPSAELGVSCQVSGDFVIIGTIPESPTPVAADSVLATVFNIKTNRTTDLLPPSDVVDAGDSLEDWNTVSFFFPKQNSVVAFSSSFLEIFPISEKNIEKTYTYIICNIFLSRRYIF